jgi:copper transport protein
LLLWLILVAGHPAAALAHATLIASDPPDGAVLASAPAMLSLSFNEPVEPTAVRMIDGAGAASVVTRIGRNGANLILNPPSTLGEGAHVVSWRVVSADGHPVGGSLTFWIGARSDAPQVVNSDNPVLRTAIWAARLAIYLGLFVGVGGAFFMAWVQRPAGRGPRAVSAASCIIALVGLVTSVGLQGLDLLAAAPAALLAPGIWLSGAHGSFGVAAMLAAAALVLGGLSLRWRGAAARAASVGALLGVGLALATTGHAANAEPRLITGTAVFLHGVSLAFWIGALVPLATALAGPRELAAGALQVFSRWIPLAVAALLASGILLAVVQLSRLDALWTTDYGRVLTAKLVLVLLLLAIALWNRLRLTPTFAQAVDPPRRQLRGLIAVELVLVVVILGIVGLWRFTPPPRTLTSAGDEFFTHLHTEAAMANVTVTPGHAGPVVITVQLQTPDERPLTAAAVAVTLSNPELGIEPANATAQRMADGQWRATMAAPVAGRWTLELGILVTDFDRISIAAPILIK